MKSQIQTKGDLTVFKLEEPLFTSAIAPEVKSQFVMLMEAEKKKHLIFDMSKIDLMDSSGLGAILMAHRQLESHNGFLALVGLRPRVKEVLAMAHLTNTLNVFATVQDVVNSLETVDTDDADEDDVDEDEDILLEQVLLKDIEEIPVSKLKDDLDEFDDEDALPAFSDDPTDIDLEDDEPSRPKKHTAKKSTPKKSTTKKTPAKKTAAVKAAAKKTPVKKSTKKKS
jgi:anti-sigma B factor antagonist